LQYDEDLSPGSGASRWGFGVDLEDDESGTRYEWFKLGLYPRLDETGLMKQYPPKIPEVNEAEAKKLVIDYLTALKQNFEQVMKRRIRSSILDDTPIEYIITVPAIWTDKSKNLTRECAVRAGMGSKHEIQIIKEPEAAGIYALDNMGDMDLDVGDTFVVCDAGGG
jgi:molecular chaperone DnaK (HSP70)